MNRNLLAEMARRGIRPQDIQKVIGKTRDTVRNKLSGKRGFTVVEAFAIQKNFFPDLDVKYLFERADQ